MNTANSSVTRFELIRIEFANQFYNMFVAVLVWPDSAWLELEQILARLDC